MAFSLKQTQSIKQLSSPPAQLCLRVFRGAPCPEFEVCNPDTINTDVNTGVPEEDRGEEGQ